MQNLTEKKNVLYRNTKNQLLKDKDKYSRIIDRKA